MRSRRKKAEQYERFCRRVTLPTLRSMEGCLAAHLLRVFQSRKPEYLWVAFWRDRQALEAARLTPAWREQIKEFEAGGFYKSLPLELVCETLACFSRPGEEAGRKPVRRKGPRQLQPVSEPEPASQAASEGA